MAATDTRAQIVEAADQLFYERGFEHTSFADIAAQVQISRGNFYYHFRTKDEIAPLYPSPPCWCPQDLDNCPTAPLGQVP